MRGEDLMCELALAHVAQRLVHVDERVHRSCRRRRNRRSAMGRAGRELCLAFVSSRWRPPCVHKGIKKSSNNTRRESHLQAEGSRALMAAAATGSSPQGDTYPSKDWHSERTEVRSHPPSLAP